MIVLPDIRNYVYPAGRICSKWFFTTLFEPATLRLLHYCTPDRLLHAVSYWEADIYSRKLYQAELPRDISVCCKNAI